MCRQGSAIKIGVLEAISESTRVFQDSANARQFKVLFCNLVVLFWCSAWLDLSFLHPLEFGLSLIRFEFLSRDLSEC